MLAKTDPAQFVTIEHPETGRPVRFHRHTENNSIWIAGTDACVIIGITNPSYVAKRLDPDKVNKHRAKTTTGYQEITWFEAGAVIDLARQECRMQVISWLRMTCAALPGNETAHIFKDPIIIEKSTLKKLFEVLSEIETQIK